ncbi:MAG: glycosyltransferase family 4 protein [Pseudomonadota bacterium]
MKLAALCDFPFWSGRIGTGVRFDSLCRSLARICDLTVICTAPMEPQFSAFAAAAPYRLVAGEELEARDPGTPPLPGVKPHRKAAVRAITHLVSSERIDAVLTPYFNRSWMTQALPPHVVRILDTHDCQSQRTRSLLRHGLVPTFCMHPDEEGTALADYDIALAMSLEDQSEFAALCDIPVLTAPFRLPVRDLAPIRPVYRPPDATDRTLLFIAAQSPVNDFTLDYLLRQIMPLVPGPTILRVIGNVTMPEDVVLPGCTIERHENVPDLVPLYAQTDVALNPTFAGGGVKTKTLEAMAYGVPVVTCDEGARGLRPLLPEACIANDKESFAHRAGQLLDAPARRAALAAEVMDRMRAEPSDAWLAPFAALLKAAVSTKRDRAAA